MTSSAAHALGSRGYAQRDGAVHNRRGGGPPANQATWTGQTARTTGKFGGKGKSGNGGSGDFGKGFGRRQQQAGTGSKNRKWETTTTGRLQGGRPGRGDFRCDFCGSSEHRCSDCRVRLAQQLAKAVAGLVRGGQGANEVRREFERVLVLSCDRYRNAGGDEAAQVAMVGGEQGGTGDGKGGDEDLSEVVVAKLEKGIAEKREKKEEEKKRKKEEKKKMRDEKRKKRKEDAARRAVERRKREKEKEEKDEIARMKMMNEIREQARLQCLSEI